MTTVNRFSLVPPVTRVGVVVAVLAVLAACSETPTSSVTADGAEVSSGELVGMLGDTEVVAVGAGRGAEILSEPDAWLTSLTPFDRQARVQSATPVDEEAFRDHLRDQALDWSEANIGIMGDAVSAVGTALDRAGIALPLPERVELVHSSGLEEFGFAYTRGEAVVLPGTVLGMTAHGEEIRGLLAHELFHVATRADPALAGQLYEALGFTPMAPLVLGEDQTTMRLTNPDAPVVAHAIELDHDGRTILAAPLDISRAPYDGSGSFFDHLRSGLVEVDVTGRAVAAGEEVQFLGAQARRAFHARVGRDFPDGVYHPEEILAYAVEGAVDQRPASDPVARDVLVGVLGP